MTLPPPTPAARERPASSADALGSVITELVGQIVWAGSTVGAGTRLCGVCGCLCRHDEACPKCRGDLVKRVQTATAQRVRF